MLGILIVHSFSNASFSNHTICRHNALLSVVVTLILIVAFKRIKTNTFSHATLWVRVRQVGRLSGLLPVTLASVSCHQHPYIRHPHLHIFANKH